MPWRRMGVVDVEIHVFLTSARVGGDELASRSCRFNLGEGVPGIHQIGGWVDPSAGLDDMEKLKNLDLTATRTPTRRSFSP
jgi:hypothetical protein